ncbi:MAG: sensor histidine kinase [Sphingobacteriaceae bacterium]|nr:sensor histidine kinase [Sphingobacteriaceae bacterium]
MNKALTYIIFIFCSIVSAHNNDSLIASLKTNIPDSTKLQTLSDLNWNYLGIDLDKAMRFAEQELELAKKSNNQKFIAQGYNDIGIVHMKRSNYREALKWHKLALEIRLKLKSDLDKASSYSKLGVCSEEISDHVASLEYALKALDIYEKLQNKPYIAFTLNTICNINGNLKQYGNMMTYARRGYKLAKESGSLEAEAGAWNYIAYAYEGMKKADSAIYAGKKAFELFVELGDSNLIAGTLNNLGYYHRLAFKDKEALTYYEKALVIAHNIGDISSEALYNCNVSNIYLAMKKYDLCEKYIKEAERLSKGDVSKDNLLSIYKTLGQLYAYTGRGVQANDYYEKYALLKDELFSGETAKQLSEMQVKYDTERKITENILLQNENELKTAQLSKNRLLLIFLIVGIILIAAVSYLLFVRTKLKQKQLLDKELLQQKELRSKAVIEAEEKERVRIARELHDGIGQQLSAAKLNISGLQASLKTNKPEEELMLKNALDLLDESVKEVRAVSHSMVPNALIKSGLVMAVREFVNKISSSGNLKVNLEIVGMSGRLDSTVENILFRVMQELVNNIIKHAQASEVGIQFIKHDKELTILIEDNGKGFDVNTKLNETDGGIGLKNIQSRIDFLNGEVIFDSYPDKGTTVTIEIPV